jgi:DhnA family fructose-bisphosphate aldolase class Ia
MKNNFYKVFREDDKAVVLAFDHGGGGSLWIDPAHVIKEAAAGGMDGILSTYGVIKNFKKEIGKMGTFLRLEVMGSALGKMPPFGKAMSSPYTVEDAAKLGVDGVMTMGIIGNDFDCDTLCYVASVSAACQKYGLLAASEILPNGFSQDPADRTLEKMNIACRVGSEIGVDMVKTVYVPPVADFKKVVANAYVPILALGGAKVDDDQLVLQNAKEAMDAGCKGLFIGRNVWGHKNIAGMAAALCAIVHENKTVAEALKLIK